MPAADPPKRTRRAVRFRRRLRTRIILSFLLFGTGLTALFAYLTDFTRERVENQLVEDVMNRNIDEFARRYYSDPGTSPDLPVQQIRAYVFTPDKFDRVREERPEWAELPNGNHNVSGVNESGDPFIYKLAVRKTPTEWFFLAYDISQTAKGQEQFIRAIYISVLFFSLL